MMPTGEQIHSVSVKKVALRELPNESGNIIRPPTNSPLPKEKGFNSDSTKVHVTDSVKLAGSKRNQSDAQASPSIGQIPSKVGPQGNLVYVRRKLETEQSKTAPPGNANKVESPESRKCNSLVTVEATIDLNQIQEPNIDSSPDDEPAIVDSLVISTGGPSDNGYSNAKANFELVLPEQNDSNSKIPVASASLKVKNQDWQERFLQLQMFLKSCDQSSQEDYMQMLRSLPAAGRSKHAVELEKRAIHLLFEEDKELQRMKVLNIFGKASEKDQMLLPTQIPSPFQSHFQRGC